MVTFSLVYFMLGKCLAKGEGEGYSLKLMSACTVDTSHTHVEQKFK